MARDHINQSAPQPVPESTVVKACGDNTVPEMELVEQLLKTDPIPSAEIVDTAAAVVDDLDLSTIPEGGEVTVGVESRGIAHLPGNG